MNGCMVGSLGCCGSVVVLVIIGMISSAINPKDATSPSPTRGQLKSKEAKNARQAAIKAQVTEINIVKENANSVEKLLKKANGTSDGELFSGYSVDDGNKLTLTTTPVFDAVSYRSRLQIATLLYNHWSALCDRTSSHKVALFHMKDVAGNEVGGAGVLSGAWVVEQ